MYIEYSYKEKNDNWGKVAQSAEVFNNIVVLPIARERGKPTQVIK